MNEDTDGDGLNDFEEINTYGTDPVNEDSDGDEVSDKKEIEIGTDPLKKKKVFMLQNKRKVMEKCRHLLRLI